METIPVFAHAVAILPELPPEVMTLVPAAESGNQAVHSMDDRRVYEIVGEDSGKVEIKDFEGRSVVRDGRSLTIDGKAAQVTVRWRFGEAKSVTVNGAATQVVTGDGATSVTFALAKHADLRWLVMLVNGYMHGWSHTKSACAECATDLLAKAAKI